MNLSVKGVKTFRGMEGHGFNATLYLDGKKVAFVMDEGSGGCMRYEWNDRKAEDIVNNWVKTLPKMKFEGSGSNQEFDADLDIVISNLLDKYETAKQCRTKIMFTVTDKKGKTVTYAVKGTWKDREDYWREYLKRDCAKHGWVLVQILNETH